MTNNLPMRTFLETSAESWRALEIAVPKARCPEFMFIRTVQAQDQTLYIYKHQDTRRYLNLDVEGNPYIWTGRGDAYSPHPKGDVNLILPSILGPH